MKLRDQVLAPLSRSARVALCILAFAGTAVYSSSFALRPDAAKLVPLATGIGISAGLAWMVLGQAILALYRRGHGGVRGSVVVMMWFDTCLLAMGVGEVVLVGAAALNFAAWAMGNTWGVPLWGHGVMLVVADALMGAMFVGRARGFGIRGWVATALWVGVLNGSFAVFLWAFRGPMGY